MPILSTIDFQDGKLRNILKNVSRESMIYVWFESVGLYSTGFYEFYFVENQNTGTPSHFFFAYLVF